MRVLPPAEVTPARQPVDETDCTVVTDAESPREVTDGHTPAARVAVDDEQRLMLTWRQPRLIRRLLAESRIPQQQVTEFRQELMVVRRMLMGP